MDIVSHGLWGGIAFGRKNRISFWLAFFFGIAPDVFSFGIFTAMTILGLVSGPDWSSGPPDPSTIPMYVHHLYNVTHSLLTSLCVFFLVWAFRKKPLWELCAWPLHILVDIPTHSTQFFPTPFLWPLFDVKIDGIPWSHPFIFLPNIFLLAIACGWYFFMQKRRHKKEPSI
ncbi:MAG TPA: hypothetical protein VEA18_01685 [Candidatus Kapabacteria bacterium]|nr:hypothetical protein [Candidatus Kapabacteria bacterium]